MEPNTTESGEPRIARMFPLGSVLLPHAPLPLHIFEERYQQLLNESLEDDRQFGVCLISRGWEVGGGDARVDIGTLARIEDHRRFDDGRAAVACVGVRRIRVHEWLDDDPYPRAMISDAPGAAALEADTGRFRSAIDALDTWLATEHRLGRLANIPELEWPADVEVATWQLATILPMEAFDRQQILTADTFGERLRLLEDALRSRTEDAERMAALDE
ncbi:MAG: LON peptidase substrate-binding domain-containing protein [Actinomycetota bacterium]